MQKREINAMDHLGEIMKGVEKGVLLTTKSGQRVNSMTISWGQIGIEWNKLIFTAYVRTGRFTHKMLEQSGEFTINVGTEEKVRKILAFCGTRSGASVDKIKELGLTLVPGNQIATPGILELPLTLECKVIYKQLQDKNAMPEYLNEKFYPADKSGEYSGSNNDYHTMFYGEIVGAYIVE